MSFLVKPVLLWSAPSIALRQCVGEAFCTLYEGGHGDAAALLVMVGLHLSSGFQMRHAQDVTMSRADHEFRGVGQA